MSSHEVLQHCVPSKQRKQRKIVKPSNEDSKSDRKRKCDPRDFRDLMREDIDKAMDSAMIAQGVKRQADVPIGKPAAKTPRLLGPILGERFRALKPRIATHL